MGIARLPQLELYWSTKHELIRQHIADVTPLVRFQQIMRFLHLNDTEHQIGAKQPGYDPLYKVRKLLDIVEIEYNLNESVSVDEAMIPFKGRLSFKQYMKDKPVKHGIKVFVLADGKYGYRIKFPVCPSSSTSIGAFEVKIQEQ